MNIMGFSALAVLAALTALPGTIAAQGGTVGENADDLLHRKLHATVHYEGGHFDESDSSEDIDEHITGFRKQEGSKPKNGSGPNHGNNGGNNNPDNRVTIDTCLNKTPGNTPDFNIDNKATVNAAVNVGARVFVDSATVATHSCVSDSECEHCCCLGAQVYGIFAETFDNVKLCTDITNIPGAASDCSPVALDLSSQLDESDDSSEDIANEPYTGLRKENSSKNGNADNKANGGGNTNNRVTSNGNCFALNTHMSTGGQSSANSVNTGGKIGVDSATVAAHGCDVDSECDQPDCCCLGKEVFGYYKHEASLRDVKLCTNTANFPYVKSGCNPGSAVNLGGGQQ